MTAAELLSEERFAENEPLQCQSPFIQSVTHAGTVSRREVTKIENAGAWVSISRHGGFITLCDQCAHLLRSQGFQVDGE